MRRVIAAAFVSLDGVMQAPGRPEEDKESQFKFGGWQAPLWDDVTDSAAIGELFAAPFDLLLGRKTYDIFAAFWPKVAESKGDNFDQNDFVVADAFNNATKYVATHSPETLTWRESKALGADVPAAVRQLKQGDGPNLLTQGSSQLLHVLMAHDLIDELRLITYPLVLGHGKRFFDQTAVPGAFQLVKSMTSPKGALIATYQRAGAIQLGSFPQL